MRHEKPMTPHLRAYSVHLLTASGAIFAMLAMLEASRGDWSMMFLWLVVAFAVDGFDGPLARKFGVRENAPQVDGVLMDLIIDYLTYVFIPAYALFQSGLLPGWPGWLALLAIVFTSAIYFADTRMKTKDNSFAGFPGCWNMLVLVRPRCSRTSSSSTRSARHAGGRSPCRSPSPGRSSRSGRPG
jgi:phosphatidylcholine synthase